MNQLPWVSRTLSCLHSVNVQKAQIHSQIMAFEVKTKDPNLQTLKQSPQDKLDFKMSQDKNKKCKTLLRILCHFCRYLSFINKSSKREYNTAVMKIYINLTSVVTILTFHQLNLPLSDNKMFNLPIYNNSAKQFSTKFCKLFLYLQCFQALSYIK